MKTVDSVFRPTLSPTRVLLLAALAAMLVTRGIPVAVAQQDHARPSRAVSPAERKLRAESQMQVYQRWVQSRKTLHRTVEGVLPSDVSVTLRNDLQTASTIYFYDDMESGPNGWTTTAYSGADVWHQTQLDANSPTHSWWAGLEDSGTYSTGHRVNVALISPDIDLTAAVPPVNMLFTENYSTEEGWDFCMVDVSTDGGTSWNHLRGGYGDSPSGESFGWNVTALSLNAFAGHHISLRFYFDTGDSLYNTFRGWFVDNVTVFDHAGVVLGNVFFDNNQNGIHDAGEDGFQDELVTAVGPISVSLRSKPGGAFNMALPFGSYQIAHPVSAPWMLTTSPAVYSVTLDSVNLVFSDAVFGIYRDFKLVRSTVFLDANVDSIYDSGDTPLGSWWVNLLDSLQGTSVSRRTDGSGQVHFLLFATGGYRIGLDPTGWLSILPGGTSPGYSFVVPQLDGSTSEYFFGNIPPPPADTGEITGTVFNDLNRNGIQDEHEPMLAGQAVGIGDPYHRKTITDSTGRYVFHAVTVGTQFVHLLLDTGWVMSYPAIPYTIVLNPNEVRDSINFAAYLMRTGSISGVVFDDMNGNGIRDTGEPALSNWNVRLSGRVLLSATSDDTGAYRFDSLWAGMYRINTEVRNHWLQTYPPSLQPQFVSLGNETDLGGINFGIKFDTTFNLSFRTFLPESLALSKDLKGKFGPVPVKNQQCEFKFSILNLGAEPATKLSFKFHVASKNVTIIPGDWVIDAKGIAVQDSFSPPLQPGDSVVVTGIGKKASLQALGAQRMTFESGMTWKQFTVHTLKNELQYAMPNALNALVAGAGKDLRAGLGGPHSVVHPTYKDVMKSLLDKHLGPAVGPPRCLGVYSNSLKPITKQQKNLPPTKMNNIMFSEAIALKTNIRSSELWITSPGFGKLIYQDTSANPYNGLSVNRIAAKLDTVLSAFDPRRKVMLPTGPAWVGGDTCICRDDFFNQLYRVVRAIDSAFSGPIGIVSFAGGLVYTPVRPLAQIPYLHLDSSFSTIASAEVRPPVEPEMPERFVLYQNYPNPFNPATTISFMLPEPASVTLTIYNALGQVVTTLLNKEEMDDGEQEVEYNAAALASGVYYYRIDVDVKANDEDGIAPYHTSSVKKMVLLK